MKIFKTVVPAAIFGKEICYDNLGCFTDEFPFSIRGVRPARLPDTPNNINTTFYKLDLDDGNLLTRTEMNYPINDVDFSEDKTVFIIHGWRDNTEGWIEQAAGELLRLEGDEAVNVVAVDWRDGAGVLDYPQAASNTQLVGRQIAIFVLANQLSNVHSSGHSLGCQIAGYAGKYTNQLIASKDESETRIHPIARITAMDPAGPMFELPSWVGVDDKAKIHVTSNDAGFVDVIHTTGGSLIGDQGLGMETAVGHADFYPNGGQSQPGCRMGTDEAEADLPRAEEIFEKFSEDISGDQGGDFGLLPNPGCSHSKAHQYWISSISRNCFQAWNCDSYDSFANGDCEKGIFNSNRMGYRSTKPRIPTSYFLETLPIKPFCKL